MKRRIVLLLSVGLNAALLLVCWQLWTLSKPLPSSLATLPARLARLPDPPSVVEPESPVTNNPVAPAGVHWSELASTDLFTYRDNLRAVGCPEATVRDILESELDEWLIERRRSIVDSIETRFWDRAAERGEAAFDEEKEQLIELLTERTELLNAVLGEPKSDSSRGDGLRRMAFALRHEGLPADLYSQVLALAEQRWEAEREWRNAVESREDSEMTPDDLAFREQLHAEHDAKRSALLGDWVDELALRNSRHAHWHLHVPGFEPTEAEWRAVTMAGLELDAVQGQDKLVESLLRERYGLTPERSAEELEAIAEARARYEASLRSTLGPERYAEYERAGDGDYRQTRLVTQRLGLDDDVAVQAWEIQRAAQTAANQLRAADGMDDARRQAALHDINAETVRVLRLALGDGGYDAYRRYAGAWLQALSEGP